MQIYMQIYTLNQYLHTNTKFYFNIYSVRTFFIYLY